MTTLSVTTLRLIGRTALATVSLSLAACAGPSLDDRVTNAVPRDYRERHPIVITDQTRTLDVPVGQGDATLPEGTRDTILGFLARYRAESTGVIQIARPAGAANAGLAANAAAEIEELLVLAGVDGRDVVRGTYPVAGDAIAPVRLAYTAVRAVVGECGQWPRDVNDPASQHDNRQYANFACANRANLAAQIANPTDLLHPRASTPSEPGRRGAVIEAYRGSGNPASAGN